MVKVHFNLHDESDTGSMCGPTVQVTPSSDGMSVEVGHRFGVTALSTAEWEQLAAGRGEKPYVLVEYASGEEPYVSPLLTYADAMNEFDHYVMPRLYGPHTGRRLVVMSREDYLKASENWAATEDDIEAAARRVASLRTAEDLERLGEQ